jgi:hypothetical protein
MDTWLKSFTEEACKSLKIMVPPAGIEPATPGLGTLKRQFLQNGYWQRFQHNALILKQKMHFYLFRLLPPNLHKSHKITKILLQWKRGNFPAIGR